MQHSACRGLRERVIRQGEMIEANLDVAGHNERLGDCSRLAESRFGIRKDGAVDLALVRFEGGYVGIAEDREPVRPQL